MVKVSEFVQDIESSDGESDPQNTFCRDSQDIILKDDSAGLDVSQNIFGDSPVYEPENNDEWNRGPDSNKVQDVQAGEIINLDNSSTKDEEPKIKRKLSDDNISSSPKLPKVDSSLSENSQLPDSCDLEITNITSAKVKELIDKQRCESPITVKLSQPVRCSPRKITKRSNSCTTCCEPIKPKTIKARSNSTELQRKERPLTPIRAKIKSKIIFSSDTDSSTSRPSVEFIREIRPAAHNYIRAIQEENEEHYGSQNFQLQLSPTANSIKNIDFSKSAKLNLKHTSEPITVKDRVEIVNYDKPQLPHSLGYNYSDLSSKNSQTVRPELLNTKYFDSKMPDTATTDTASTDTASSNSPADNPSVTSKLIQKLSNGNSSTPTEGVHLMKRTTATNKSDDCTPDMDMSHGKNTFQLSTNTTPSTISPLQNGHHNFQMTTPTEPVFELNPTYDEDGEFLALYIVRTDNELGSDLRKEYQRVSRRFTIDPYLADISKSNSPSSVSSIPPVNIPNRPSNASSTSSSSSNRTSDGAFIIPQAPGKNGPLPIKATVIGKKSLLNKVHNMLFPHSTDSHHTMSYNNTEEKISTSVQVSPGSFNADNSNLRNGNASPLEISRSDRVTPKSSLKKARGRGKRQLGSKTKRAILPTQAEEPEYMQGMNSPEMIPANDENAKQTPKREIGSSNGVPAGTPKSKKKIQTPRPATPLDMSVKFEESTHPPGTLVLAKWIDRRYYSGQVKETVSSGKYVIDFDDGHTKTLLDEFIIFGDLKELPLNGQSVYAMIDEDQNYEPGLVLGIDYNSHGTVTYRVTTDGDAVVSVTASELYMTEDQAASLKETRISKSPNSTPSTPRRRGNRELDLDNIIHGPRSARTRDKGKRVGCSPRSPKAGTSGTKSRIATPNVGKKARHLSESSEISEGSNSGFNANMLANRVDEVAGVEPEFQKTPKKVECPKADLLQLKGVAKQNVGKKNWKFAKFENDEDTSTRFGPVPEKGSKLFSGLHFLLTCTDQPSNKPKVDKDVRAYSSEEDGETSEITDADDLGFSSQPFNKERLKEQLETGGGTVYSHFEDIPKSKYSSSKLIAPKPCLTAKYIKCLAADIRCVSHGWVIACCIENKLVDYDSFALPAGWSISKDRYLDWVPQQGKRNTKIFKDKLILICNENESFVKFWDRVCSLVGANTKVLSEDKLDLKGALAVVTDLDCSVEVQNKANHENIPLVSTTWVVQCLIENRLCPPKGHEKYSFIYTEPE